MSMEAEATSIQTTYVEGQSVPWVPFTPLTDEVLLRYYRIDRLCGEMLVSARVPPHLGLAPLYTTGTLIVHTIRGSWRYRKQGWVARAGDTVHVAAGSTLSVESVGDEETEVFLVVAAELLFFDEDGGLVWQETWKTSMERYADFCAHHRIDRRGLTGLVAPTGG